MTDTACVICAKRPPADGWTVCQGCAGRLDGDLERIAELTRLAAGWLDPRTGTGSGVRSVPASRPPIDLASLDACIGHDVLPVLEAWQRLIREEAHLAPYGAATEARSVTVGSSVQWLRSWLLWAFQRPDFPIDDLAREVADLRWSLERLDPDRDKPGLRIPCPSPHHDGDGRACGYRIVVDAQRMADDLPCPRCDTTWSGNRLVLVALNDPGVTIWAYPDVIADTLSIPPRTLRHWADKGWVARIGSRYDVGAAFRRKLEAA